ncbi:MAG: LD-carboxypeptidase [Bacteroidales bacterium]|nr:LD-carboxypeptidase [Bacteroidales bacterium]
MIVPKPLQTGDKAIIVSPAGKIDPEYVQRASELLTSWGLIVEQSPVCLGEYGRFSASAEERLEDLQKAFDREDIRLILCSRGGYGVMQFLDKLTPDSLLKNPKWIIGYSDITALHAMLQKNGLASLHAPMARHLSLSGPDDVAVNYLKSILWGKTPDYTIAEHPFNQTGKASGILRGGNLSLLYALRGTPFDFDPEGTILFVEDIGERAYHIDRMFQNLRMSGILERISGLIIGEFTDCEEDPFMKQSIYEGIYKMVAPYSYPVCFGFPVGHSDNNYPLLCGNTSTLIVQDDQVILKQN